MTDIKITDYSIAEVMELNEKDKIIEQLKLELQTLNEERTQTKIFYDREIANADARLDAEVMETKRLIDRMNESNADCDRALDLCREKIKESQEQEQRELIFDKNEVDPKIESFMKGLKRKNLEE